MKDIMLTVHLRVPEDGTPYPRAGERPLFWASFVKHLLEREAEVLIRAEQLEIVEVDVSGVVVS